MIDNPFFCHPGIFCKKIQILTHSLLLHFQNGTMPKMALKTMQYFQTFNKPLTMLGGMHDMIFNQIYAVLQL